MTDLETPWATPEGVPAEAQWFDGGLFTQGREAFVEESWSAETPVAETPVTEARTGERWPESPFETPVEGFLEEGATTRWESFSDTGVAGQGEGVPGCGSPVSGTPPLIYRSSSPDRSRNPWVGRAQTLLNVFLARQRAGTESCTDQTAATKSYIATLRPKLGALGQDPLGVDCVFGEGTETATLMFQACRALLRDGKIGEKTWPELLALETTPPVPTPTPTPVPTPTPTPTPPSAVPAVRVREDVWTLSAANPWHPTLLWYARGVAALKARVDPADPRSWAHLAATHGTFAAKPWPAGAEWNSCEHECWHFLPWHRGYLHHFESIIHAEILRMGGPGDWALPFWNYSDTTRPDVLKLPPAFRAATLPDGTTNELLVAQRRPGLNSGDPISTDVTTTAMMGQGSFTACLGWGASVVRVRPGNARGAPGIDTGRPRGGSPRHRPRRRRRRRARCRLHVLLRAGGARPHLLAAPREHRPALGVVARRAVPQERHVPGLARRALDVRGRHDEGDDARHARPPSGPVGVPVLRHAGHADARGGGLGWRGVR